MASQAQAARVHSCAIRHQCPPPRRPPWTQATPSWAHATPTCTCMACTPARDYLRSPTDVGSGGAGACPVQAARLHLLANMPARTPALPPHDLRGSLPSNCSGAGARELHGRRQRLVSRRCCGRSGLVAALLLVLPLPPPCRLPVPRALPEWTQASPPTPPHPTPPHPAQHLDYRGAVS